MILSSVKKNIASGIYGEYTEDLPEKETLEVAEPSEIETGLRVPIPVISSLTYNPVLYVESSFTSSNSKFLVLPSLKTVCKDIYCTEGRRRR